MSGSFSPEVDIGALSLSGLEAFSTVLATLSSDDVQPAAMLQLEQLGRNFPISGPLGTRIPDYLRRTKSTRLDRLGLMVGWRKGDAASLMAHSADGQAVALLATCLENLYGNESAATIFYQLSRLLLPDPARFSSPKQLAQLTGVLANKLGAISFGTILAKQICRIHSSYDHLQQKVPASLLARLGQDGMSDILAKFAAALREPQTVVRVRGCASMGYVYALASAMFPDDCIVTVEGMIIHQGSRSASIIVDITQSRGGNSLEVQLVGQIASVLEIKSRPSRPASTLKFAYQGHFSAYMHLYLQEWGLECSMSALTAMGICLLSLSDVIYITIGERASGRRNLSNSLFSQVLGDLPTVTLHKRCEFALGVSLPLKWPAFSEAFTRLKSALAAANQVKSFTQLTDSTKYGDPSEALLRVIDEGVASLVVHAHEGAVWQERSDPSIWHPSHDVLNCGTAQITMTPRELVYKLFSWEDTNLVITSNETTTLVPSGILHLGSDLCHYRGLELFDGLVFHENQYYHKIFAEADYTSGASQHHYPPLNVSRLGAVYPTMDGVYSDLSLTVTEHVHGLTLGCSVVAAGQRKTINLRECVDQLFGLLDAYPCQHPRKTPLRKDYVCQVQTNSVLMPDARSGHQISIVQAAGNPISQFLSLTRWEPSLLCRKCCLNCAYEQAREKDIHKIIVA
jgi:hypothetical protein